MPSFRAALAEADYRALEAEIVREVCADDMRPANLFVSAPLRAEWEHRAADETYWEVFEGRLLDGSQTRERRVFELWGVHIIDAMGQRSVEPILAVRFDADGGRLFVTRAIQCYGHESYDAGGNVILTREVRKWQRELVSTIRLDQLADAGALRDELACQLFHAVVGTSRLPLTSIEAPLPGFTFGQIGYWYRSVEPSAGPMTDVEALVRSWSDHSLTSAECVKLLELLIRATPIDEMQALAESLAAQGTVLPLLRAVFNTVSLSPYTDFAAKSLALVRMLVRQETVTLADRFDFLCHLIRQLARHLAAYDLKTFHHRGANYPDALLVDDLWAELLPIIAEQPHLFAGNEPKPKSRRRAVRQALLLRLEYAGHAVPDAPTSPGENLRVLPQPFGRVSEDQIYSPITRSRRLFTEERFPEPSFVRLCLSDLDDEHELQDLGTALFLDRPLGFGKLPGEPDQTPLASHVLFSRTLAAERLDVLARRPEFWPAADALERWRERLRTLPVDGRPLRNAGPPPRPGVVSLHDALRVADDWIFLRTTQQTVRDFSSLLTGFSGCCLPPKDWRLILPGGTDWSPTLIIHDGTLRPRVELAADLSNGYRSRGGVEFPAAGFRIARTFSEPDA